MAEELVCGHTASTRCAEHTPTRERHQLAKTLDVTPGETGSGTSIVPGTELGPFEKAAAGLIEAGLAFLESIAARAGGGQSAHAGDAQRPLSALFSRDPRTNRPILSIPLPASVAEGRLAEAVIGFLRGLRT